jgi:hypothetical protein
MKNLLLFQTKLDEDKLYIKVVHLEEIYNFIVDNFLISNHLNPSNLV